MRKHKFTNLTKKYRGVRSQRYFLRIPTGAAAVDRYDGGLHFIGPADGLSRTQARRLARFLMDLYPDVVAAHCAKRRRVVSRAAAKQVRTVARSFRRTDLVTA